MKHLLKDFNSGFKEMAGDPLDSGRQPLRPWAVTPDGRVVYADWKDQSYGLSSIMGTAMGQMRSGTRLKNYDKQVSLLRRREFETELARDASSHSGCYRPAIDLVTTGLTAYVNDRIQSLPGRNVASVIGTVVKARCYSDTGSGRLGTLNAATAMSNEQAWQTAQETLLGTDIAKILGIQAALANKLHEQLGFDGNRGNIYNDTKIKVGPSQGILYNWFDPNDARKDGPLRGRVKRTVPLPATGTGARPTSVPGITQPGVVTTGDGAEERIRGIDEWKRVEGSDFVKGIDLRNLEFGAGRSGTTGDLLKTFRTFGTMDTGETFKQYLLAIVVYLVGGGHHTCHEIFSVANLLTGSNGPRAGRGFASVSTLVKDAYVPGKYLKHLPDSYISTPHFQAILEKYYDIGMLGHLHGTFT